MMKVATFEAKYIPLLREEQRYHIAESEAIGGYKD